MPDLRSLHIRAPCFGVPGLKPPGGDLADLVLPAPGVLVGDGGQPRLLDRLRELLQWAKRYGDVAVARRINTVRRGVVPASDMRTRAHARRPVRGVEPSGERFRLQVKRGLHEARIDPAALAGALAPQQRGQNSHGEQRGAVVVDRGYPDRPRPGCGLAGNSHEPE